MTNVVVEQRTLKLSVLLSALLGPSDGYWLRAQAAYDTEVAHELPSDELQRIRPWSGALA